MTIRLIVADVGHGNSTILLDGAYTALVDAAPGGVPEQLLREAGITRVDDVLISHADEDHVGGLPSVLSQFDVGAVWINGDGARSGHVWNSVRAAIRGAESAGRTVVHAHIGAGTQIVSPSGRLVLKVLAPSGWERLYDTGNAPPGRPVNRANGLSAIVLVYVDSQPQALLPGDAGRLAFADLNDAGIDLRVPTLAFPHHGGQPGGSASKFASDLCVAVEPRTVIFSVGRDRPGFPRPDVVSAVRQSASAAHVACTQLALTCAATVPAHDPAHLRPGSAGGKSRRACCAGTVEFSIGDAVETTLPVLSDHRAFVEEGAPTRMCR